MKEKSSANLYIAKGDKSPAGLKDAGLEEDVVLVVKGKIISLSSNEWNGGKSLNMSVTQCKIIAGPITLDKAIEKSKLKV